MWGVRISDRVHESAGYGVAHRVLVIVNGSARGSAKCSSDNPELPTTSNQQHRYQHDYPPTLGGDRVIIRGSNLGPQGLVLQAGYGISGRLRCASCTVTKGHTEAVCITVPGSGEGLHWTVSASNSRGVWASPFSASSTRYESPTIHSLRINDHGPGTGGILSTHGGDTIEVNTSNIGPAQPKLWSTCDASLVAQAVAPDPVQLVWGPAQDPLKYRSTSCRVIEDDRRVRCDSVGGTGAGHSIVLAVAGQQSTARWNISYVAPILAGFLEAGFYTHPREAGFTHPCRRLFWPLSEVPIFIIYYATASPQYVRTASCIWGSQHSATCTTVPGSGVTLFIA